MNIARSALTLGIISTENIYWSLSADGRYIVSGSEDHCVYIWDLTDGQDDGQKLSFLQKERHPPCEFFEGNFYYRS